jgi:predicted negative regulator of RcsB-dependent stress response
MADYQKSAITRAVERKAHLKKNIAQLVEQTQDVSSAFNVALSALKNNNPEAAIQKFEQVLELDDSSEMLQQVMPNLGQALLQTGQTNEAITAFRNALKMNQPDEIKAFIYANLGYIYTQCQLQGFAIKEYRQATQENRRDTTSWLTLGMLYENSYRFREAQKSYKKVLSLDEENAQALESIERLSKALPVKPREDSVRLIKMIPTLGVIVAMSYDQAYEGYFPMVIYVYPESPLKADLSPGMKILNVFVSGSETVEDDDERDVLELLDTPARTDISLLVGETEIHGRGVDPIQRKMEHIERIQVYKNWLQTFDSRLTWLWGQPESVREALGPIWGVEMESLLKELKPLEKTHVYDFTYAMVIEHLQAFSITEKDPESEENVTVEMQYQINLGRFFGQKSMDQVTVLPDLIQQFQELQFNYLANYLAGHLK